MTTLQLPRTEARLLTDRVSIGDKIVNALLLPVEAAAFVAWCIAAIGVWGVTVLVRMTFLAHLR